MIGFLKGTLVSKRPPQLTVDVGGVGYEVFIPLSSFDKLPQPGGEVKLLTHLSIRDDAHVLYGFMTDGERDLFRLLIRHVSGIGPKIALNVLSGTTTASLSSAVANGDVNALSRISGVGKKTAERIVVELKDKLGDKIAWAGDGVAPSKANGLSPVQESRWMSRPASIFTGSGQHDDDIRVCRGAIPLCL